MTTRDLLERDKEALLGRISGADTPQSAVTALDDELGRILLKYSETNPSPRIGTEVRYALSTARAALSLIDSNGEIKTWEEAEPKKELSAAHLAPFGGGALAVIAAGLIFSLAPDILSALAWVLLAVGAFCLFYAGLQMGRGKRTPDKKVRFETRPDSDKIYHALLSVMTVIDSNLEDARLEEAAEAAPPLPGEEVKAAIPADELSLLGNLLMSAYASREEEGSREIISDIRFYLHKKGIEVVDYTPDTARYFSRMPSKGKGTLSPALIQDGTVLVKGLAAAGQ